MLKDLPPRRASLNAKVKISQLDENKTAKWRPRHYSAENPFNRASTELSVTQIRVAEPVAVSTPDCPSTPTRLPSTRPSTPYRTPQELTRMLNAIPRYVADRENISFLEGRQDLQGNILSPTKIRITSDGREILLRCIGNMTTEEVPNKHIRRKLFEEQRDDLDAIQSDPHFYAKQRGSKRTNKEIAVKSYDELDKKLIEVAEPVTVSELITKESFNPAKRQKREPAKKYLGGTATEVHASASMERDGERDVSPFEGSHLLANSMCGKDTECLPASRAHNTRRLIMIEQQMRELAGRMGLHVQYDAWVNHLKVRGNLTKLFDRESNNLRVIDPSTNNNTNIHIEFTTPLQQVAVAQSLRTLSTTLMNFSLFRTFGKVITWGEKEEADDTVNLNRQDAANNKP